MRRAVIGTAIATVLAGGGAAALAQGPGPNGHNDFGLCTAYAAGSQTGQDHKHQAPPFQALEAAAQAQNETVEQYCSTVTPGGK